MLLEPLQTGTAKMFALRHKDRGEELYRRLTQAELPMVRLRSPLPWEPLAPLRHLCEHLGRSLPEWDPADIGLQALWLGSSVALSRFFLRVVELLSRCKTIAWIGETDLQTPVWSEFLWLVRQQQLNLPISFVYAAQKHTAGEIGILMLDDLDAATYSADTSQCELSARCEWPKQHELPKQQRDYLTKALIFGDTFDRYAMSKVSLANHERRIQELIARGLLDCDLRFCPELLRFDHIEPPFGHRWRKSCLAQISRKSLQRENAKFWLCFAKDPILRHPSLVQQSSVASAILSIDPDLMGKRVALLQPEDATPEVRLTGLLAASHRLAFDAEIFVLGPLPTPYAQLAQAKLAIHREASPQNKRSLIAELEMMHRVLSNTPWAWAAALIAVELARWHLAHGRLQQVFTLLKPHQELTDWIIRWQVYTLLAATYVRLVRFDLAHNALERAVACVPKPISPVLIAEIRLLSSQLISATGDTEASELQLKLARDTFLAASDGIRLGRYLLLAAENKWKNCLLEDARNLFGRALDLFRRYRDAFGVYEAQLKLGLVINGSPPEILGIK
jgi:tetratricopeptide (TPR) repeat protein